MVPSRGEPVFGDDDVLLLLCVDRRSGLLLGLLLGDLLLGEAILQASGAFPAKTDGQSRLAS